jgi:hypothetical protein
LTNMVPENMCKYNTLQNMQVSTQFPYLVEPSCI